jgi:hypothetical protein
MNQQSKSNITQEMDITTKRFSVFGVLLFWLGLIPMGLILSSESVLMRTIGAFIFLSHSIVWHRCMILNLLYVTTKNKPHRFTDDIFKVLFIAVFITVISNFAIFGFNTKIAYFLYVSIAIIITLRTVINLKTNH